MTTQKKTNTELKWLKNNAKFLKISAIEKEIGCPATTIHKFVEGSRPLPDKWEEKIINFIKGFKN